MSPSLAIEPLDATFGATIRGAHLRAMTPADEDRLIDAWHEYGLLLFPGQHLTPLEQVDVAQRFGDLEFTACAMET